MLYFIPGWYQQNTWCEKEQYWYARRSRTEYDDTVKHIQLFHRSQVYPFQIMLLSYAPNFRHFLHRQSVFHARYWSCFDAIQEVQRKKIKMFSFHNLNWPEHIEFVYSQYALVALLKGKKYAQVEFGEDGNPIQVDIYQNEMIQRRNIYDDRGFVSGTILYENAVPIYQDYLTDKGVWKLRHFFRDNHVEINLKSPTYLLECPEGEYTVRFQKSCYEGMDQVVLEVLTAYLKHIDKRALFCVAMHELHTEILKEALKGRGKILSFYGDRYDLEEHSEDVPMVEEASYIIADSEENLKSIQGKIKKEGLRITEITPFDSRVDFGISQQLNVQKIMVPVDGIEENRLKELIEALGKYLKRNENAQVHLFTRVADYDRKRLLVSRAREVLEMAGLDADWAREIPKGVSENRLDTADMPKVRFFVEQCVDELSVSKCMREQRIIVDMRDITDVYLRVTGLSTGIPQIIFRETQFVENGKNGRVIQNMKKLPEAISYYLDGVANWNEAMVYSYELGKKFTTGVLIDKWREVIDCVERDSGITTGE